MSKCFLFPCEKESRKVSCVLLAFRVVFGVLFLTHGWEKLSAFEALSTTFPDPLGVGATISLSLAIFAEVVCAAAFIIGFLHRLVIVPMAFTMLVAIFVVHAGGDLAQKELAVLYLTVFAGLFFTGAGQFSVDYWLSQKCKK